MRRFATAAIIAGFGALGLGACRTTPLAGGQAPRTGAAEDFTAAASGPLSPRERAAVSDSEPPGEGPRTREMEPWVDPTAPGPYEGSESTPDGGRPNTTYRVIIRLGGGDGGGCPPPPQPQVIIIRRRVGDELGPQAADPPPPPPDAAPEPPAPEIRHYDVGR